MYLTRGWMQSEMGDLDVIVHQDRLHLFHLNLPSHDVVSHLVSDDGMTWSPLPNALRTGDPGDCDDDEIWTMHVFRWQGRFYMLYTALAAAEDGRIQRTGLAVSDDLICWRKVAHNPVAEPDPRWYEADLSGSGRADWRDPFPWLEDDTIHALVCAHECDGPFNRRGCIAHLISQDALHWTVQPPFYTPRISTDFEVPCVFRLAGRHYLIGHIVAPPRDVYRVADSFAGPWRRPHDDLLLPAGNHAFHAVEWRGQVLLFNWIRDNNWNCRGDELRLLPAPRVADCGDGGELYLRSFDAGWDAVAGGDWEVPELGAASGGQWRADAGVRGRADGMAVQFLTGTWSDFDLEVTVAGDAAEFGVVFRSDDQADRYLRLACQLGYDRVELAAVTLPLNYNALGRGYARVQSRHRRLTVNQPLRLRLIARGPCLEVSVDGRVLLAALKLDAPEGLIGFFVEDGTASFSQWRSRRLAPAPSRLPRGPIAP